MHSIKNKEVKHTKLFSRPTLHQIKNHCLKTSSAEQLSQNSSLLSQFRMLSSSLNHIVYSKMMRSSIENLYTSLTDSLKESILLWSLLKKCVNLFKLVFSSYTQTLRHISNSLQEKQMIELVLIRSHSHWRNLNFHSSLINWENSITIVTQTKTVHYKSER